MSGGWPANRARACVNCSSAFWWCVNCVLTWLRMKNAAPPTAATASTNTTITAAISTDTHVLRLLWLMAEAGLRYLDSLRASLAVAGSLSLSASLIAD